mgnify:CR=1 FL=1
MYKYSMFRWLRKPQIKAILPKIDLSALWPGEISVKILEPDAKDGNVSLGELVAISQLVKLRNPLKIFEIGTFDGRMALNLALNSPPQAAIYTLDLAPGETAETSAGGDKKFIGKVETGFRFKGREVSKKIEQLFGDSTRFDFSPYQNSMDFIFVDGSHAYEYVLKDSENALKMIKPGGIILFHDYNTSWPGVTKALNELFASDLRFKDLKHISGTSLVCLTVV